MDLRENIQSATQDIKDVDIIIDDASHASHHQQNAFVTLFPKLRSGGLYIIEDLRWQRPAYEAKRNNENSYPFSILFAGE